MQLGGKRRGKEKEMEVSLLMKACSSRDTNRDYRGAKLTSTTTLPLSGGLGSGGFRDIARSSFFLPAIVAEVHNRGR